MKHLISKLIGLCRCQRSAAIVLTGAALLCGPLLLATDAAAQRENREGSGASQRETRSNSAQQSREAQPARQTRQPAQSRSSGQESSRGASSMRSQPRGVQNRSDTRVGGVSSRSNPDQSLSQRPSPPRPLQLQRNSASNRDEIPSSRVITQQRRNVITRDQASRLQDLRRDWQREPITSRTMRERQSVRESAQQPSQPDRPLVRRPAAQSRSIERTPNQPSVIRRPQLDRREIDRRQVDRSTERSRSVQRPRIERPGLDRERIVERRSGVNRQDSDDLDRRDTQGNRRILVRQPRESETSRNAGAAGRAITQGEGRYSRLLRDAQERERRDVGHSAGERRDDERRRPGAREMNPSDARESVRSERRQRIPAADRSRPSLGDVQNPRQSPDGGRDIHRRGESTRPPRETSDSERRRGNVQAESVTRSRSSVTNMTNVTNISHNSYFYRQRTVRHYSRPHFGSWWAPYRKPSCRTSAFFAIRFGHPGFTLTFTKYGSRTAWHWWYGYGCPTFAWSKYTYSYVCPTWRYRTWWRPTTIYHTWYTPRVTHIHHVYSQPARVQYVEVPRDPCPYGFGEAWGLIAAGEVADALTAFACLADENPYDGLVKIGHSIAYAMIGFDELAVAMMRRAMTVDTESVRFVPSDEDLDHQILSLAAHFGEKAKDPMWRADGLFMMAALRAALGDIPGAHFTVAEAIRHGDDDPSAQQLRDLLTDLLHKELYGS
jgi:hypothetical protein